MRPFLQVENHAGSPILVDGARLLPFARSVKVILPVINSGFVWNRPISVLMVLPDGEEQVLPIRDRTREIVWTLYGAMAVLAAVVALLEFRRRGKS